MREHAENKQQRMDGKFDQNKVFVYLGSYFNLGSWLCWSIILMQQRLNVDLNGRQAALYGEVCGESQEQRGIGIYLFFLSPNNTGQLITNLVQLERVKC